jgi:hypothetical protein
MLTDHNPLKKLSILTRSGSASAFRYQIGSGSVSALNHCGSGALLACAESLRIQIHSSAKSSTRLFNETIAKHFGEMKTTKHREPLQ